jgi:uncharacterized protein YecE (DUF72 family)
MTDAITTYIHDLTKTYVESTTRAESNEDRRQQEEAAHFAERATPLTDRLKRIISAMPETERNKPRSLEFFAERLRGRQRLTPHRGELAAALRALGWTRQRRWHQSENGFKAYWQSPVND